jgi:hypothetical protein
MYGEVGNDVSSGPYTAVHRDRFEFFTSVEASRSFAAGQIML